MDVLEISLMNVSDPRFQAKFWEQVVSNGLCWEWQGAKNESGYGLVWVNGKLVRAHRVSYVMAYGSIATDKVACHTCDNPSCVNPMHIYAGTVKDNVADCVARGRQRGRRGERLKKYPLSTEEIIALRTRYSAGSPIDGLAKEYGIGRSTAQRIVWGYSYADAPGPIVRPGKRGRRVTRTGNQ